MEFFLQSEFSTQQNKIFFNKITQNNIDTFCDIRQRRGVRGSKYSFVNSNKLQQQLSSLEIKYGYIEGLAPTSEIRELQKEEDLKKGELKSERKELGRVFVIEYQNKILKDFDFEKFFENLDQIGASKIVLFCVEELAKACHRSIVADKLADTYNYKITHL